MNSSLVDKRLEISNLDLTKDVSRIIGLEEVVYKVTEILTMFFIGFLTSALFIYNKIIH